MRPDHKLFKTTYLSLKEHLDILRKRPGMYLGEPLNVESLRKYLDGYDMALFIHNIAEVHSFAEAMPHFHQWVAMKEDYYNTIMGWNTIITEVTNSDEESLALFFKYYDEYMAREATVLFEYIISAKDIKQLISISNQSTEERARYIDSKVQIISYDDTKNGVFERWINKEGTDIYDQYILHASYDNALEALRRNFKLNFEQHLHPFRIACAWKKILIDLDVVDIVSQSTKAKTIQMIMDEKSNVRLCIVSGHDDEWKDNISGLEPVAERIVELSVDPKLIQHADLVHFTNLKILHLAFGLPRSLPKLEALTTLYLANWHDYYAEVLPQYFPSLEHLDIDFFNAENLLGLCQLKLLKNLALGFGGLKSLEGLEHLSHLEELHISMNTLENVTILQSCPQLKVLHLEAHSDLLEIIDLYNNKALVALRIEHTIQLKHININRENPNYSLEKIFLNQTESLQSLDWIVYCTHLKEIALSFKSNKVMEIDVSNLSKLTKFYGDCAINSNSIQRLLSNTSIQELFLSRVNAISDFKWLTPNHQLRCCYLYFSGESIDWDKIFSCIPNDWQTWQIECTQHLITEHSSDEIKAIAKKYGYLIKNIHNWSTSYPLYQF